MSTSRYMFRAMVLAMAGMVLVFLGVGQILANQWRVDTTRSIAGSPAELAALLIDLRTWSKWQSTDAILGPQTAREVVGEAGTVGQRITWSGAQGQATLVLTAVAGDSIDYEFLVQAQQDPTPQRRSRGHVDWASEGAAGCRVHWREDGTWDTIVGRWFGWFGALQDRLRQTQGTSLEGLQLALEEAHKATGK